MLKSILDVVVRVPLHLPVEREFPSYEFLIAFQRDEKLPVRHVLIVPSRLRCDPIRRLTQQRATAGHNTLGAQE